MNKVKNVPRLIPPTITHPISSLASDPGPLAKASGIAPKIVDIVVISIGRKRKLAALTAAASIVIPFAKHLLANSTIKIPCLVIKPIRAISPI
jgi:hypothetical protein|tara:strand:+ start:180 stop:458 length:279 start_codon:yes stop_codon:yes gene_type:complete